MKDHYQYTGTNSSNTYDVYFKHLTHWHKA